MRSPRCSISLWSDLIHEISSPPCVKQRRNQTSSWPQKKLHPDTPSLPPVSEMRMKLLQAILRSKWRRFAWQSPEAQGSDLSGNLFFCRLIGSENSRSKQG